MVSASGSSPVAAHPPGQIEQDGDVVASARGRLERLAHALHAALAVGHGAFGLAPRRAAAGSTTCASSAVCGQEDILHDEEVETLEQVPGVVLVGLGLERVLADDVQRAKIAVLHRLEHLATGASRARAEP